ncbi:MAG TPA: hypothetical protein VGK20_10525 [Candidatus Binatia bacterium]|jgi:hypothetical protein
MKHSMFFLLSFVLLAAALPNRALANCQVGTGVSQASPISTNDTSSGGMNHVICGQTVKIYPGTGSCEVIQRDTATGSVGATCLHLGRGVKFTGGYTSEPFTCPAGISCGTAIAVDVSASSGTTQVNTVYIAGGWGSGIVNSFTTVAAQVNSAKIALDPTITSSVGIDGFRTVNTSEVSGVKGGGAGVGITLYGSTTVTGSSIHDNDNGVYNSTSNTLTNTLLAGNAVNILHDSGILSSVDMRGLAITSGTTCNCSRTVGGCTADITYCGSFIGANVSFVDYTIEQ